VKVYDSQGRLKVVGFMGPPGPPGTQSVTCAELSNTASVVGTSVQVASAAATSVDGRVNSVNVFISGISARSVGGVSTHGLQSVVDALSNRISGIVAGTGSVTSAEVQVASAAATSADAHAAAASAAATSADAHANTVSARVVSASAELASLVQIASLAATSADAHANTVSARVVSASAELASLVQIASAAATSADAHANTVSAAANTVSARVVSVSAELASLIQIASAAATSADAHANTVSGRAASISAELASLVQIASAAATSVDGRVASLSAVFASLSARSVGNVSTHGLQSIINVLSNRISAVTGGTGSVTSTELSAASAQALSALRNLLRVENVTSLSGPPTSVADGTYHIRVATSATGQIVSIPLAAGFLGRRILVTKVKGAAEVKVVATPTDVFNGATSAASVTLNSQWDNVLLIGNTVDAWDVIFEKAALAGGTGSVTSAELQTVSAQAASAKNVVSARVVSVSAELASLVQIASAAATSADSHANTVSARLVSASAELASLIQIASAAATSSDAHANTVSAAANTVSARLVSASAELASLIQIASAAATSADAHANTVSARAASISSELASLVQIASAAATSADAHANTVSARAVSISAELASLVQIASAAATSVDGRVNSVNIALSAISARSVGNVSTHGLQSVVNALSNRISAVVAGAASVTSNELSAVAANQQWHHSVSVFEPIQGTLSGNIQAGDQIKLVSRVSDNASIVAHIIDTEVSLSADGGRIIEVRNAGTKYLYIDRLGRIGIGKENLFSVDIGITRIVDRGETDKAWINIAQVDTYPGFTKACEWWANTGIVDGIVELAWLNDAGISRNVINSTGDSDDKLYIQIDKNHVDICKLWPGTATPPAYLFDTITSITPTQKILIVKNVAGQVLAIYGAGDVAFGSAVVLSTDAVVGFMHVPTTSGTPTAVPTISVTGKTPIVADNSANALWMYNTSAATWFKVGGTGGTASVTSTELSAVGNASTATSSPVLSNALSNDASVSAAIKTDITGASTIGSIAALSLAILNDASVTSALKNASTIGSIAALSLALSNDASVSAVIKTDINSVSAAIINEVSIQYGRGQFKMLTTGAQAVATATFTKVSGLSLSIAGSGFYQVNGQLIWSQSGAGSASAIFNFGMSMTAQPVMAMFKMVGNIGVLAAGGGLSGWTQFGGNSAICATPSIMYSSKPNPGVSGSVANTMFFDGVIQGSTVQSQLKVVVACSTAAFGVAIQPGSYIRAYKIG
jgi:hypothetical protein